MIFVTTTLSPHTGTRTRVCVRTCVWRRTPTSRVEDVCVKTVDKVVNPILNWVKSYFSLKPQITSPSPQHIFLLLCKHKGDM